MGLGTRDWRRGIGDMGQGPRDRGHGTGDTGHGDTGAREAGTRDTGHWTGMSDKGQRTWTWTLLIKE
jgi:hypothetical protein